MSNIHSSALISPKAELGDNISVGPFTVIEDNVKIGNNCIIGPNVIIYDGARIGNNVKIYQGASVANHPQDLKFNNEESVFEIGDNTIIREFATLHRGTIELKKSVIGKNCLLMAYAHGAHACIVGDNCIHANCVQLGGHVEIDDWVIIGGGTLVHQFEKVGKHAMIGGGFRITSDVPPFVLAAGEPLNYNGLNTIGLRRRGFSNDDIYKLKEIYSFIYSKGLNLSQAKDKIKANYDQDPLAETILEFIEKSTRGIMK
jgi:UDP-N-acetylglucosamine acyltransferase